MSGSNGSRRTRPSSTRRRIVPSESTEVGMPRWYGPAGMATDRIGLFGPDTVTWRVNREAVLLAGGGRALLLQVAHPLVAAGVVEHSRFEADPWGRPYRTLDLTRKIVFGEAAVSAEASRRLRARHASVHGVAPDGRRYDANDPDLMLWVWATLVDSALVVYQRYVRSLSLAEVERYYREQTRFAVACGVPEGWWPGSHGAFVEYFERVVRDECVVGEDARRIADGVLHPGLPWPVRAVFEGVVGLVTVGLLPRALRERYGRACSRARALASDLAGTTRIRFGGTGTGSPWAPRGRGWRGRPGRGWRGRRAPPSSPAFGSAVSGVWWMAHHTRYSRAAIGIFSPIIRNTKVQPIPATASYPSLRDPTTPPVPRVGSSASSPADAGARLPVHGIRSHTGGTCAAAGCRQARSGAAEWRRTFDSGR